MLVADADGGINRLVVGVAAANEAVVVARKIGAHASVVALDGVAVRAGVGEGEQPTVRVDVEPRGAHRARGGTVALLEGVRELRARVLVVHQLAERDDECARRCVARHLQSRRNVRPAVDESRRVVDVEKAHRRFGGGAEHASPRPAGVARDRTEVASRSVDPLARADDELHAPTVVRRAGREAVASPVRA